MKKSLPLTLFLSAVLMGELLAQPVITSPTINLQPPVPTRAHTMKADARNTRDGAGRPANKPAPKAKTQKQTETTVEKAPQIHRASADGQADSVKQAVTDDPSLVQSKDVDGYTPLHHAAIGGHAEVVEVLIESGAKLDGVGSRGETALFLASSAGNAEVVELLAKNGADPNKASADGKTPLPKAAMAGHAEVVEVLLGAGADATAKDRSGRTALELAERYQAGDSRLVIKSLQEATL